MTLKLIEETPGAALGRLVDQAVHLCFSASVIDIEDVAEHGLSGTHAAMIREIRERVDGLLTPAITQDIPDRVDEASRDSFPLAIHVRGFRADRPAEPFIWRGRTRPNSRQGTRFTSICCVGCHFTGDGHPRRRRWNSLWARRAICRAPRLERSSLHR